MVTLPTPLGLLQLLLLLLTCGVHPGAHATRGGPTQQLVLYAHESREPGSATTVTTAAPSGNLTSASEEFGTIKVFSNVLRASADPESAQIGSQVGIVVLGKEPDAVYLSYTYYLNGASGYNNGTIAVQGQFANEGVYAVVGGTGDFLFATGQDERGLVIVHGAHFVLTHKLTIGYAA